MNDEYKDVEKFVQDLGHDIPQYEHWKEYKENLVCRCEPVSELLDLAYRFGYGQGRYDATKYYVNSGRLKDDN